MAVRLIYPEDASSEDRETLAAVARAHGLGEPISLSAFGERLFRKVYKERLPLVGYSLPAQIARIASDWTDGEAGSFSFILWTRPCPPGRRSRGERERRPKLRNGEIENGDRPRIAINPLDGQRSSIRFHGRGRPDAEDVVPEGESKHKEGSKYVFPGHFVDLQRLASALSGKRVTSTAEAYVRFGLEPVISPAPQSGALTPETVDAALDELPDSHVFTSACSLRTARRSAAALKRNQLRMLHLWLGRKPVLGRRSSQTRSTRPPPTRKASSKRSV